MDVPASPAEPAPTAQPAKTSLGDRMKAYERAMEQSLIAELPVVARLDGHGFSKFTSGLTQPFDRRFTLAMCLTSQDLLIKCQARTAYCQSDEISLVFAPTPSKDGGWQPYDFSGRVMKLATLMASYAGVRFGHHLRAIIDDPAYEASAAVLFQGKACAIRDAATEKELSAKMAKSIDKAHFDCRIFQVPTMEEAVNCIYWRNNNDCVRNVVSKVAQHHFGHKACHKQSTGDKLRMLATVADGDPMLALHPAITFGCFLKLEKVTFDSEDKAGVQYQRNRVVMFSTLMSHLRDTMPLWVRFVQRKVLEDGDADLRAILAMPVSLHRGEQNK